jgi:filamentous hemagglutinin
MFQATAEQKADAGVVANYLPQTAAFYIKNGIRIPSAPAIAIATQRSNTIRDTAAALTKLAAVASGATALVGLSPTLLTWALSHPAEATSLGMITTETAAAIQSGAITPALVMEAGAVKVGVTGTAAIGEKAAVFGAKGVDEELGIIFSAKQLDKKFKHAEDFGLSTAKKNPETLTQYQGVLVSHMTDPATYQHGTYQYVLNSTVHFNPVTNNVVVVGKTGEFITGWKLTPGTPQFKNYLKNGVLR